MCNSIKTEVLMLGTLHGMHKDNEFYSYEDVFSIIDDFNPDVIGVEIRKEDIKQSREYLKNYYPYEMIETKFRYENKFSVYGFDWLGESIEGKLIPDKYFENHFLIALQKEYGSSQDFNKEKELLKVVDNIRLSCVKNRTPKECNDGKYDTASSIYYSQLDIILKDTPFQKMGEFYRMRDFHIDNNIINIIKENQGKKLIFLLGMDHRGFAVKSIEDYFGGEISFKELSE